MNPGGIVISDMPPVDDPVLEFDGLHPVVPGCAEKGLWMITGGVYPFCLLCPEKPVIETTLALEIADMAVDRAVAPAKVKCRIDLFQQCGVVFVAIETKIKPVEQTGGTQQCRGEDILHPRPLPGLQDMRLSPHTLHEINLIPFLKTPNPSSVPAL